MGPPPYIWSELGSYLPVFLFAYEFLAWSHCSFCNSLNDFEQEWHFLGGGGGRTFVLLSLILQSSSRVMEMADKLLLLGSLASTHEMIFWKAYRMNTGWEGWLPEEPARLRGMQPSFPFLNILGGQRG